MLSWRKFHSCVGSIIFGAVSRCSEKSSITDHLRSTGHKKYIGKLNARLGFSSINNLPQEWIQRFMSFLLHVSIYQHYFLFSLFHLLSQWNEIAEIFSGRQKRLNCLGERGFSFFFNESWERWLTDGDLHVETARRICNVIHLKC